MTDSVPQPFRSSALLCLVIAVVVVLLQPLGMVIANWTELSSTAVQLMRCLAVPFAILLGLLLFVSIGLVRLAPLRWPALLCALAVGLWLQGHVFVWGYGSFDGAPIDWSAHRAEGVLEILVWMILLGAALARPARLAQRTTLIALLVTALELGSLGATWWRHAPLSEKSGDAAAGHDSPMSANLAPLTLFSTRSNVLIVVLDMFQSDFFADALRDTRLAERVPPGFTYYRNAVSLYPTTRVSLQSILTSRSLDQSRRLSVWQAEEMADGIPTILSERGYQAAVLSFSPQHLSCYVARFGFDCFTSAQFIRASGEAADGSPADVQRRLEASQVLQLGLFQLAPHFLKPLVFDGLSWRLSALIRLALLEDVVRSDFDERIDLDTRRDLAIFRILSREILAADVAPTFRFLHFHAAHYPNTVDEDCEFNGLSAERYAHRDREPEPQRRAAVAAGACSLRRLFDLFDRLEEVGAYDNSLIFVVGDHGNPNLDVDWSLASPRPEAVPVAGDGPSSGTPTPGAKTGPGVPLFLAKRVGERGALRISDLPVSLCDIPASVASELGLRAEFDCESIFEMTESRRTPRLHHRYAPGSRRSGPPYRFDTYQVEGHSWWPQSWANVSSAPEQ